MSTNFKIPIYIVSLKQDIARREKLREFFPENYPKFNYIEAVDGRILPAKEYYEKTNFFYQMYKKIMLPTELGCTLSHVKVLERFVDSGDEVCLILEDDVMGTDENIYAIENILKVLPNCKDFLFFWGMHKTPYMRYQVGMKMDHKNYLVHKLSYQYLYGTFAYSINRGMAVRILCEQKKYIKRADDWGELLSKQKNISVYFNNILRHPDLMLDSHIEQDRKREKKSFLYRLVSVSGLSSIIKRIYIEILILSLILIGNRRLK